MNKKNKNIYFYINKLYLYILQNKNKNKKSNLHIAYNFVECLEFYKELTKDESILEDIENIKKCIKLYVFFGEKFNLYFGQFVNKNTSHFYNDNSYISYKDIIAENKKYEKYYKYILDECELFYDLFITQIIIS